MKSLRNHFSVIFPLVVLLLSIQLTSNLEKIVKDYEKNLINDYNIIVVSKKDINKNDISSKIDKIDSITPMSAKEILSKLEKDISKENLKHLKQSLPKFYSIKLGYFPTDTGLKIIKQKLEKLPFISKAETFSKTHNKIYNLFVIAKYIFYTFTFLIFIISFLLILKQMTIWLYEHKERIEIMTLFGAPFWKKSARLYMLAIVDSIVASILVVAIYHIISSLQILKVFMTQIEILTPQINMLAQIICLLIISLVLSVSSVSIVMLRINKGEQ